MRFLSLVVLGCLRCYFMAILTLECFCSELLICYPLCQTCASGCFLHPHVELDGSAMTIENLVSSLFDIFLIVDVITRCINIQISCIMVTV